VLVYFEVSILDLSNGRNRRGVTLGDPCAGDVLYLKGSYVIREREVGMTRRLKIVGLEDEVSSHIDLEGHYIQDWNHRTSWNRTS
jgi:hypothetical protein